VGRNPLPYFKRSKVMPYKYSILSSHADASPKAGTKTSTYPPVKGGKKDKKVKPSNKKGMY
jgi:hypothetical protein